MPNIGDLMPKIGDLTWELATKNIRGAVFHPLKDEWYVIIVEDGSWIVAVYTDGVCSSVQTVADGEAAGEWLRNRWDDGNREMTLAVSRADQGKV